MKNNHIRIILCLFMCCALLFASVARPVAATEVAVAVGLAAIPVAVAIACSLQALGYMSSSNSTSFTNTVNQASSWFSNNTDWVLNGFVTIMGLTSGLDTVSYLPKSFVQDVWQWLFSSSNSISLSSNYSGYYFNSQSCSSISQALIMAAHCPQAFSGYTSDGKQYIIVCGNSSWVSYDGSTLKINGSGTGHSKYVQGDTYWTSPSQSYTYTYSNMTKLVTTPLVQSDADVKLGNIQTPYYSVGTEEETIQIEIAPIYIDWTKYGVPDPNDPGGDDPDNDGKFPMWLPTGIPSPGYDDSVITQNQQQAQSGVVSGDITFEPYEPDDPGTGGGTGSGTDLSSVIQAIVNVPTAIVSGIGDFFSDFFGFNGKHEDYVVQLRDFFPFCIPFDLYDFITVLSAEPEAPVFHWEIPVPQLGQTFELEVDLSAWDDIAVLFRNLELLAFIFGLAVMTREKFLRS